MTLRQLEIFRAVSLSGTLSGAARDLALTQPAVSLQMKQLQLELGTPIFTSRGKRFELSKAGEVLAGYAERILRLTEELKFAVTFESCQVSLVRVAASSTPGIGLLPPLIARFRRRQPDTVVRLEVLNTEAVEERVASGEADFGIVGGRLGRGRLQLEPWREDELVLIVPRAHPLARRRTVEAEELATETLLTREHGSATRATYEAAFHEAGLPLPRETPVGTTEAIRRLVEAGLGLGIVSRFSVSTELRLGTLRALRIRGISLTRPLFLVFSPRAEPRGPASEFVEFLRTARISRLRDR